MSFSDALERKILDHVFMGSPLAQYSNLYIGLTSTTPNEDGTGITEPSAGSYARVSTSGADWTTASTVGGVTDVNNANEITFPTATADWAGGSNLTHVLIYDAPSGGELVAWGAITTPRPVLTDDTVRFTSGKLKLTLD